jgi:propanol-preferring alcohol dehydrogenase
MKAMMLHAVTLLEKNEHPLQFAEMPVPVPKENEILIKVKACGVCHTELDEIEGRTAPTFFPVIPGHQIVGIITDKGKSVSKYKINDRVGVGWFYSACGKCEYCMKGLENLCSSFKATGRDVHGGYAEYISVPEDAAFRIPDGFTDAEAAPLLCGGAIGYRSLKLTNIKNGDTLGLTGFGASGHQVLQLSKYLYPCSKVFVFSRNEKEQQFALSLGADWAGDISSKPPELLSAIIDTTPAWKPIVESLGFLKAGGRLVINAIRKEDKDKEQLLKLDYQQHLWMEKEIKSVANITTCDIEEFLQIAAVMNLKPTVITYPLEEANKALLDLKRGSSHGAKALII